MRNFQFRVWDGEKILWSDEIGHFAIDDLSNGLWLESMLNLGYSDKNGTAVYQDDILKVHKLNQTTDNHYYPCVIAPHEMYRGDIISHVVDFEIIGNIHQNPELLKLIR